MITLVYQLLQSYCNRDTLAAPVGAPEAPSTSAGGGEAAGSSLTAEGQEAGGGLLADVEAAVAAAASFPVPVEYDIAAEQGVANSEQLASAVKVVEPAACALHTREVWACHSAG